MFASSQFDGNAAFSGGGFMPSQATKDTASSSAKKRDNKGLLPQTVKQMIEDTKSISYGADVENVTLVGRVSNTVGMLTAIKFILDDGTGRVQCTKWMNDNVDEEWDEIDDIQDGMYVEALGEFRGFYGTAHFIAVDVRILTEYNEEGGAPTQAHMMNPATNTPLQSGPTSCQPAAFNQEAGAQR